MTNQQESGDVQPITQTDLESFARKLEAWAGELPAAERGALTLLLAQARATNAEDVQGYLYGLGGVPLGASVLTNLRPIVSQGIGMAPGVQQADAGWFKFNWDKAAHDVMSQF